MRVPVTGLIGHPGETRALPGAVSPDEFGDAPWGPLAEGIESPVELDLHLDAVVEGILVRGTLGFTVRLACARCLEPQQRHLDVAVAELFVDPARRDHEDEIEPGYEIIDDATAIDLSTLARDALVIDLPVQVLCRDDCLGLCATCGADRNRQDCGHHDDDAPDPRWAALANLDLPSD